MHLTTTCLAIERQLVSVGGLFASLHMHVPLEEVRCLLVAQDAVRKILHATWAQIRQTVRRFIVMEELPGRFSFGIGLVNIHVVDVEVDREHSLLIKFDYHVGRVLFGIRRDATADIRQHDRYFRIGHAVNDFVVLGVRVTVQRHTDDTLEALH